MPIKPGPVPITIGSYTLMCDSMSVTYDTVPFDRVEYDHEKQKTAPLSTGVTPQIVTLLGGIPAEITIDCALQGIIAVTGATGYVPRPLAPNIYTSDTNNIKQRVNITRWKLTASSPESATLGSTVDGVFTYQSLHKNMLAQFQNRLTIFSTPIAYEILLNSRADNIQSLYFTTGVSFSAPGYNASNVMVVDGNYGSEFLIKNAGGTYDIYKGYDLTLEQRIVTSASSA